MSISITTLPRTARPLIALAAANTRFWPSINPLVGEQLRRWHDHATTIPDPELRALALTKLREEAFNAQVAATLVVLTPRHLRRRTTEAIVALQVLYDVLDGLSEAALQEPLRDGLQLYRALTDAVGPNPACDDYYRPRLRADGGYLQVLAETTRSAIRELPAIDAVAETARHAARRCGQAQSRTHAIPARGVEPLRTWATAAADGTGLAWWEHAAGAAAAVLCMHALITLAADPATTPALARRVDRAYLHTCAMSTLLDSLVDRDRDRVEGNHSFLSYYATTTDAAHSIARIAQDGRRLAAKLPHGEHHEMTVAGVAGYYLSTIPATDRSAAIVARHVKAALSPTVTPVLAIFAAWRTAKRLRSLRRP